MISRAEFSIKYSIPFPETVSGNLPVPQKSAKIIFKSAKST